MKSDKQIETYEKMLLDPKVLVEVTPERTIPERESGLLMQISSALVELFSLVPGGSPNIYILGDTLYECLVNSRETVPDISHVVHDWKYGTSHGVCGGFQEEHIDIKQDLVKITQFHPPLSANNTGLGTITDSTYVSNRASSLTNRITIGFLDEGNFLDTELFLAITKVSNKIFVDTQEDCFRVFCDLGRHLKLGGQHRPFYLLEVYKQPATLDRLIRWYRDPLLWMAFSLRQRTLFAGTGVTSRILNGENVTATKLKRRTAGVDFEDDFQIGTTKDSLNHVFKFIDI